MALRKLVFNSKPTPHAGFPNRINTHNLVRTNGHVQDQLLPCDTTASALDNDLPNPNDQEV